MKTEAIKMWDKTPGMCEEEPILTAYYPNVKKSDGCIVIFPGGAYSMRAPHEGKEYAEFLADKGILCFVCDYRVAPHKFPLPLVDARRAVRYVRYNAEKFGINKKKVYVMGSSAGGHLAAITSTYREKIDFEDLDEIDRECSIPNGQILCYPVIKLLGKNVAHLGSGRNLLFDLHAEMGEELSPDLIADEKTPGAFMWHTFDDAAVNVINTLDYAKKLRALNIDVEIHIYPNGVHGLGLAPDSPHVAQWSGQLVNWLKYNDMLEK